VLNILKNFKDETPINVKRVLKRTPYYFGIHSPKYQHYKDKH